MARMRLILLGVIAALGLDAWRLVAFFSQSPEPEFSGVWPIVAVFEMLATALGIPAAIFMLISTLFRVEVAFDGRLMYDASNPWWKVVRCFSEKMKENGTISLCGGFWTTCFVVFVGYAVVLAAFLTWSYMSNIGTIDWAVFLYGIGKFALAIAGMAAFVVGVALLFKLFAWMRKKGGTRKVIGTVLLAISAATLGIVLIVGPILQLHADGSSYLSASFLWIGFLVVAVSMVCRGEKLMRALRETALWHFVKSHACPILYAKQGVGANE